MARGCNRASGDAISVTGVSRHSVPHCRWLPAPPSSMTGPVMRLEAPSVSSRSRSVALMASRSGAYCPVPWKKATWLKPPCERTASTRASSSDGESDRVMSSSRSMNNPPIRVASVQAHALCLQQCQTVVDHLANHRGTDRDVSRLEHRTAQHLRAARHVLTHAHLSAKERPDSRQRQRAEMRRPTIAPQNQTALAHVLLRAKACATS